MRLYLDVRPEQQRPERFAPHCGLMATTDLDDGVGVACWSCQHFPGDEEWCTTQRLVAENIGGCTIEVRCAAYEPTVDLEA